MSRDVKNLYNHMAIGHTSTADTVTQLQGLLYNRAAQPPTAQTQAEVQQIKTALRSLHDPFLNPVKVQRSFSNK